MLDFLPVNLKNFEEASKEEVWRKVLTRWQVHQIVTSSKVLGTLFVLKLMQIQFFKQEIRDLR